VLSLLRPFMKLKQPGMLVTCQKPRIPLGTKSSERSKVQPFLCPERTDWPERTFDTLPATHTRQQPMGGGRNAGTWASTAGPVSFSDILLSCHHWTARWTMISTRRSFPRPLAPALSAVSLSPPRTTSPHTRTSATRHHIKRSSRVPRFQPPFSSSRSQRWQFRLACSAADRPPFRLM